MSTGMKRFTKGCLLTALAAFILGAAICSVGGLLGGFRQLEGLNIKGITGIPFRYHDGTDGIRYGFGWDDDWDDDVEWAKYKDWNRFDGTGGGTQLNLTADTLRNLYIQAGACELFVKESQNDHVWLEINGADDNFRYREEDGDTLRIVRRPDWVFWNWARNQVDVVTKVYLYLPKDAYLNYLEVYFGAGNMESIELNAREAEVEVGAGVCTFDGLTVTDCMEINAGAGQINIGKMDVNEVDIEAGVGQIYIENARVGDSADVMVGVGEIKFYGIVHGNLDVECDLGNVTMRMEDREKDHNYEIECSMGNVRVGNITYTSLGETKDIYNGSNSTFDIECSLGNVNISFAQ